MSISLGIVEAEFTAEEAHLILDVHDDGQVTRVGERVSRVFEGREQVQRRIEPVRDLARWFDIAGFGHPQTLRTPCDIPT